jgi:glycosyltransferase involved in cell wall biosynthesis
MELKNKRFAIWYDNRFGRNDGPPLYYYHAMKQMGLNVVHLLPEGDPTKDYEPFDYHFWVDWGEDALPWKQWEIPKDGGKTIYVISDAHLGRKYRFDKAWTMDYAFFNQKKEMEEYINLYRQPEKKPNTHISWLPHAFEPKAYPNIETIKKYDVCFIGHIQNRMEKNFNGFSRAEALDRLFHEFPNFYYGSRHPAYSGKNLFEDAARHFSESKVVFNVCIHEDINMRLFEVLGTGSFLLTNWIPTLPELFKDGVHLVTYKSLDEMVERTRYYLKHEKIRMKIASQGYKEAIAKHTYTNRLQSILEVLGFKVEGR